MMGVYTNMKKVNLKQIILGLSIVVIILLVLASFVLNFVDIDDIQESFFKRFTLKIKGWNDYTNPIMYYAWFLSIIALFASLVSYFMDKYKYFGIGMIVCGVLISITVTANLIHYIRVTIYGSALNWLGLGYWAMVLSGILAVVIGVMTIIDDRKQ